ncbi:SMP-30/gluconolactonase/LRE family protein [Streptomyces sp. JB150]|uniref:SMP-30/gluconolactonase/LRE family protein n=1 Tax=Streptomyces sp. JB150 TaxID=2714844 RepID=UPI0014087A0E|nr:SMP-30/gluconolactonase/LRE family protein [Streptomyces sp. JB150]QIJ60718.1 SMP-30/gluconolactonase/LRE family protein [Streptomyces sp. JB150]
MTSTRRLISPRRWTPPPAPADQGRTHATRRFVVARRLPTGGHGPEDVVFDRRGALLTGLGDGSVVRMNPTTGARTVLAGTGGRPLGLEPCPDGGVLVCDHDRGLLRVGADGSVHTLVDSLAGRPLTFAGNVVRGPDGTIWFTVSTRRWDLDHYLGDILEHSCTGMLVRRDTDGTVTVLLDDLKFANGLVLVPDASHLLVAETAGYRVCRYWLTGPRAGTVEPFAENLAGLPDNMSLGTGGLVWVSLAAPRNALLDSLLPRPGLWRTLLWNLPRAVRPGPASLAWVMAFDLDGRIVHDLRSDDCAYGFVTSVAEHDGTVVAASLHEDDIVVLAPLPPAS